MTLATTCPQCATTFRLQAGQLRQRGGMVRCGVCRHAFNAIDALQPLDDASQPGVPASTPAALPTPRTSRDAIHRAEIGTQAARGAPSAPADDAHLPGLLRPSRQPAAAPPSSGSFGLAAGSWVHEPVDLSTHRAADAAPPRPADGPVPARPTSEPLLARPSGAAASARPADAEAVSARPAPRSGPFAPPRRPDRVALAIRAGLVMLLAVAAALQVALLSRDALAAWAPDLKPALVALAGAAGLRVELPRRLSGLTIEGFDLQAGSEPSQLVLSALVRNTGATPAQWPAMELTLTDASGAVVARKALLPVEYLPDPARLEAGIEPRSELPIRLVLQTPEGAATRYGVSLFYP